MLFSSACEREISMGRLMGHGILEEAAFSNGGLTEIHAHQLLLEHSGKVVRELHVSV